MTLDLWRIRFKDGIKAADSRLVWASTKEWAEELGRQYCDPRGYRFVGADLETVGREGEPMEPVSDLPPEFAAPLIKAAQPIKPLPPPSYGKA